jgi:cyclopropane-fatty-acyl-phospholipid synthase
MAEATRTQLEEAIRFHYDLPPAFFKLFIDPVTESYTCAYFKDTTTTLEEAQQRKLNLVFKKLQLKPGDRVLDIGCGWGNVMFAAVSRGCRATGLTLAPAQAEYIRSEAERRGVADRIEVVIEEARFLPFGNESFDKVVTLGATEHVEDLGSLFTEVSRILTPDGLFLQHAMTGPIEPETETLEEKFIRDHVWPIGRFQRLFNYVQAMEEAGLEVVDVHDLTDHYPHTLIRWLRNLERAGLDGAASAGVEPERYRAQAMLFAGAIVFFAENHIMVYQQLARPIRPGMARRPLSAGRDQFQLDDPEGQPLPPPVHARPLVQLEAGGLSLWVEGVNGGLVAGEPPRSPDCKLMIGADTLLAITSGRLSVPDAFVQGQIGVEGDLIAAVQVRGPIFALGATSLPTASDPMRLK